MSVLSRALQCLKPPKRPSWHIFIHPDPRTFRLGWRNQEFQMQLERNPDIKPYIDLIPIFNYASNPGGSRTPKRRRKLGQREVSGWVGIQDSFQTNAEGKILSQVLVGILDKFASYDLESEKGVEAAIYDIEARLNPVATFVHREHYV